MFHLKRIIYASVVLATLPSSIAAWAATYYVATTGSNSNTCVQAQNAATPKQTIPAGIGCLVSGDTLMVKAGTYSGQEISNPPGGSAIAYTIVRNFPGDRPKITLANQFDRGFYVTRGSASSYIEVRGFEFDGVFDGAKVHGDDTIGYPHHIRFIDNKVHHTVNTGMLIASKSDGTDGGDHLIQGNEFYQIGIGTPGYHGMNTIYNTGNRTIVEDNVFHNSVNGVTIYTGSTPVYDVIVRRNVCYDMFRSNIDTWQVGANGGWCIGAAQTGGRHQIYNNIVYRSGSESSFVGIAALNSVNDVKIFNNTIYNILNAGAAGIRISSSTNIQVRNNIAYLAGVNILGGTQSNNFTSNPSFVDPANGNFRLQSGSAARDTGMTVTEVTHDFERTLRPQGASYDIGAFEAVNGTGQTGILAPTGLFVQ